MEFETNHVEEIYFETFEPFLTLLTLKLFWTNKKNTFSWGDTLPSLERMFFIISGLLEFLRQNFDTFNKIPLETFLDQHHTFCSF